MRPKLIGKLILLLMLVVPLMACGIPEEEHQAVVKDRDELKVQLAQTQQEAAETEKKLKGQITMLETKIAELEEDKKQLQAKVDSLTEKVSVYESDKGTLEDRLKATTNELAKLREAKRKQEARLAKYREIAAKLQSFIASGKLKVNIRDGKMVIELSNNILFDSGKTKIKDDGKAAIVGVAGVLKTIKDRDFLIAGHTDNEPVSKGSKFASNWELSTARAVSVVTLLQESGLDPSRLAAAGYGEHDPVASNEDKDGRALNRRIEIILMPNISEMPELPKEILGDGDSKS